MRTTKQTLAYSISALALVSSLTGCGSPTDAHGEPIASASTTATSLINFVIDGISRSRLWTSPDGRIGFQAMLDGMSSALEIWPTPGSTPHKDSLGEITLNRYLWPHDGQSRMERLNISAMVDETDNGAYRIGVEAGNGGIHRDIIFCFESPEGQPANCQLRITPNGVFVKSSDGTYKQL